MEVFGSDDCKIIHADAIGALETISDNSIDLIFADPPYNIGKNFNGHKDKWTHDEGYLEWCYTWLNLCCKKLRANGSLYVMTSTQFMPYFDIYLRDKLEILSRIVWSYDSSGVQAKNYFGSMYEPILFCVKDKNNYTFNSKEILIEAKTGAKRKLIDYRKNPPQVYNSQKVPGNVWEFSLHKNEVWKIPRVRYRMDEYENHPTQKPIALLERIIKASSNKNDLVLDPFSGTFTTGYVAKNLNRNFLGIELQEEYVKIGLRRLKITTEYKGEALQKELRSFEAVKYPYIEKLSLFKEKMENTFTQNIKTILKKHFDKNADDIYERSQLLQYIKKENAVKSYSIESIVDKYMSCIEEIINVDILSKAFENTIENGYLKKVLDEIITQSKIEFNYEDVEE